MQYGLQQPLLCAAPCIGNMPLRRRMGAQRVGKIFPTRLHKDIQAIRHESGIQVT